MNYCVHSLQKRFCKRKVTTVPRGSTGWCAGRLHWGRSPGRSWHWWSWCGRCARWRISCAETLPPSAPLAWLPAPAHSQHYIKLIKIILLVLIHLHRIQNEVNRFKSIHLSVILLWSIKNGRQTFSIQEVFFVSSCKLFSLVLNYSYSCDVFRYLGRMLKSFLFITLFCAHRVSRGMWEGYRPRHVTSPRLHL